MKKTYLVKKDPSLPCRGDNWIIMNGYEFSAFIRPPEGESRKSNFCRLDACSEDDAVIFMECDEKQTRDAFRSESNRRAYLRRIEMQTGFTLVSLDGLTTDNGSAVECIPDEGSEVENTVLDSMEREQLGKALSCLEPKEKDLITALILSEKPMSEREYGKVIGITHQCVHKQKVLILAKLKKFLGN